ncbi:helicase-associated domain-containing protein [Streptomyces sp. NPDC001617]
MADRETSGTASVWRLSAGSIRRALDAGSTADDITADLAAGSATALPQPLTCLIADTARGHGRVRIAPAACAPSTKVRPSRSSTSPPRATGPYAPSATWNSTRDRTEVDGPGRAVGRLRG